MGGKVVARQLTAVGVTVYVGSPDARRGQAAVDEIGGDARLLVFDVTGPASITDAACQLGARDVLVNNAGISLDSKAAEFSGRRGFRRLRETNKGGLRSMRLLGLDHIAIVVRDINETVARAGDTVDGRAGGERILAGDIDLQFLLFGETRLELIEVRAAGFGMPKLKDGETAVIGHLGYEVDDLEDAKAELTRRGVVLQGEFETDEVRSIFTAPETTFGVTLHLMEHKGRGTGA